MEVNLLKQYKSIPERRGIILPNFTVITGKNGCGKSHFLEAISATGYAEIREEEKKYINIKYVPFNGLNPYIIEDAQTQSILSDISNIWRTFSHHQSISKQQPNSLSYDNEFFKTNVRINDQNIKKTILKILEKIGKHWLELTEEEFRNNFEVSYDEDNLFYGNIANIFKLYHIKKEKNNYNEFRNTNKGDNRKVLTDEEFIKLNGIPPWVFINEIFNKAKLAYRVNSPENSDSDSDFKLFLEDVNSGNRISPGDLSTGEKVLMSLAMAVYSTSDEKHKVEVLLLDEPDAALHPEFSKVLVEILKDEIVKKAKVNVVMTTHSPSTVAICDDTCIFEIDRVSKEIIKKNKNEALDILTNGIDNLRVSVENRRQVFVESINDAKYYEKIYTILKLERTFPTEPLFLPPHTNNGSNCSDVIKITTALIELGNDLVYGVIDYDGKNKEENNVLILGNKRYSIENYIFDPILLGCLLIREKIVCSSTMGIGKYLYRELISLKKEDFQKIADYIQKELGLEDGNKVECKYENTYTIQLSEKFLMYQGHELETLILSKWEKLKEYKKNREDAFKLHII